MAATIEDGPAYREEVNHEERMGQNKTEEVKFTYRSYKKKFKKMKIKFDAIMNESNDLFVKEQQAEATIAKLAFENDAILELILDINDSPQIPADKRYDLNLPDHPKPAYITDEEIQAAQDFNTPEGQAIWLEISEQLEARKAEKERYPPGNSLAALTAATPHHKYGDAGVSPELIATFEPLEGQTEPIGFLTEEAIDAHLAELDSSLEIGPYVSPSLPLSLTAHDIALKNPHSVYNWLRRNDPKVFLQDGEGSEKSSGKPGSLRGAGKRSSMPAPAKTDALEIVEEDGLGYDPTIAGLEPAKGGKRKRDDDGGYHPKSGTPGEAKKRKARPKKIKAEGETSTPTSSRKKQKLSSPMAVDSEELEGVSGA